MSDDQPDMHSLLGINTLPANLQKQVNANTFEQAVAQMQQGQLAQARTLCEQLLDQNKQDADALHLLALIAMHEKQYAQAVNYFSQVIQLQPNNGAVYFNLGQALLLTQQFGLAEKAFARLLQALPDMLPALLGMGQALGYLGRFDEALQYLQRVIADSDKLPPAERAMAWMHQGMALGSLGKHAEAMRSFEQAISLDDHLAQAHFGMANAMMALGKLDNAETALRRVSILNADFPPAILLLGRLLWLRQQNTEAAECFDRVIQLAPKLVDAHYGRGLVWQALGEFGKAGRCFSEGLKIAPDHVLCLQGLGNALVVAGQYEYALNAFRRADALQPGHDYMAGMQVYLSRHICLWHRHEADLAALREQLHTGAMTVEPFAGLALFDEPMLHARAALLHMQKYYPHAFSGRQWPSRKDKERIRIAYVSSDFYNHATAYLIAGLLEKHDRNQFEIFVLSYGQDKDDAMRKRIKRAADKFVDINRMSDPVVAEFCRHQQIDIAVDLKGLTRNSRSGIFAQRAAPIQINYLGYPGTMAAPCYDYMIADRVLIPAEQRQHYREAIVYMPNSYQANDQTRTISRKIQKRSDHGLPEEGFVFCCFNSHYKITPEIFACWMRILLQVPESVLWLLQGDAAALRNLSEAAERHGVAANRLIFAPAVELPQHLARLRLAQLSLDTLPYGAHTTASDALWVSLPHVTCMGQSFPSRVAASLLNAIEMPELITHTLADYESMIVDLATDPAKLRKVKQKLAKQIKTAPLFDTTLYTKYIESAFVNIHKRRCAGEAPADLFVICHGEGA